MDLRDNTTIAQKNPLPPHAWFPEDAMALEGAWRVFRQTPTQPVPQGWEQETFDDSKWPRLSLSPQPLAEEAPEPSLGICYRKAFSLARDRGNRRIILRFSGVSGDLRLWLNGVSLGTASCPTWEVEFDLTDAVRPDRNLICLELTPPPQSEGKFLSLLGPVHLYALPQRAITDLRAKALFQGEHPAVQVQLTVCNAPGFLCRIALMEENQVVAYGQATVEGTFAQTILPCPNVTRWNEDDSKCYRIAVILWDGVAVYHTREISFGFRQWENLPQGLCLNGVRVPLFALRYPLSGTESEQTHIQALEQIKASHFNTLILPPYVPDSLLCMCDRLGLYALIWEEDSQGTASAKARLPILEQHPSVLSGQDMSVLAPSPACLDVPQKGGLLFFPKISQTHAAHWISQIRKSPQLLGAIFGIWPLDESFLAHLTHQLQPIELTFQDNRLTVENHSPFSSTKTLSCKYILTRDGSAQLERPLSLSLRPGEQETIPIETRYDMFKPGQYQLNVVFHHPDVKTPVAWGQWSLGAIPHIYDETPGGTIREEDGQICLRAGNIAYLIHRSTGAIHQILYRDQPLLTAPAHPIFSLDGPSAGLRLPDLWEKVTLGKKKLKPSVLEVDHMTRTVTVSYRLGSGWMMTYRLCADGALVVECRLRTDKSIPRALAMAFPVPPGQNLSWLGFGPWDQQEDIAPGNFFGRHHQPLGPMVKFPVYACSLPLAQSGTLTFRSAQGFCLRTLDEGLVFQGQIPAFAPHTTYNFHFTIVPEDLP